MKTSWCGIGSTTICVLDWLSAESNPSWEHPASWDKTGDFLLVSLGKLRGGGGCGDCHAVDVSYIQELVFDECAVAFSLACSGVAGDAGTDSPGIALCAQC
ncbi:hypothetical protein GXU14_004535 [Shigella flexneri]|nr:hypothetical protein [Shigella flexneri]